MITPSYPFLLAFFDVVTALRSILYDRYGLGHYSIHTQLTTTQARCKVCLLKVHSLPVHCQTQFYACKRKPNRKLLLLFTFLSLLARSFLHESTVCFSRQPMRKPRKKHTAENEERADHPSQLTARKEGTIDDERTNERPKQHIVAAVVCLELFLHTQKIEAARTLYYSHPPTHTHLDPLLL